MLLDIETLRAAISTVNQSLPSTRNYASQDSCVCTCVDIRIVVAHCVLNVVVTLATMHATELQTMFTHM